MDLTDHLVPTLCHEGLYITCTNSKQIFESGSLVKCLRLGKVTEYTVVRFTSLYRDMYIKGEKISLNPLCVQSIKNFFTCALRVASSGLWQ